MRNTYRNIGLATLAALILTAAPAAAFGHGPGGDRHGGGFPDGGMLEQLIHPCGAACFVDARNCREGARATALTCVESTCPTQITAAQAACKPSSTFEACKAATSTLRSCGQSCLDAMRSTAGTCRDTANTCITACRAGTPAQ
jgi:hypothetical protein